MDQTSKAVKLAVIIYRVVAVFNIALTIALFVSGGGTSTRTIVFVAWLALGVYSLIRIFSDVLSGQRKKEQNFSHTLGLWEQNTGSHAAAMRYFTLMIVVSSVLKLAVPFVIWAVFK